MIRIDADNVNDQYFAVENDPDKDIVTLANHNEKWAGYFTTLHNRDA